MLIAAILRALGIGRLPAILAALTFFALPYVAFWAPLFRVDCLALALSLTALLLVVKWPDARWSLVAAALFVVASLCTRQTYALAAPTAVLIWVGARSWKRAVGFAALSGLLVGMAAGALDHWSDGGIWFHLVTANVNEFRLERLAGFTRELVASLPVLVGIAIVYAALALRARDRAARLIVPYLIAAAIAALTIGKTGSNVNYWLEVSAAMSLATGALFCRLQTSPRLSALLAVALLAQSSLAMGGGRYREHLRVKLEQRPRLDALTEVIRNSAGPVLADEELGLLPLVGRRVELQPFEMTQLARSGAWDESPLLESLERQKYETILLYRVPWSSLHRTRWTPAMLERIERDYRAVARYGPTTVYRARGAAVPPWIPATARDER